MKNIVKGWFTTVLGLVIMVMAALDFYHIVPVPAPEGVTETQQVLYAFLIGVFLFLVPRSKIERLLIDRFKK